MQSNKLRMAVRATAAVAVFGMAGQASAISFESGGYEATVYGFARIAAVYDIDQEISNGGRSGIFSSIDTSGSDTVDGHFSMDANTSRLGVKVVSPQDVKVVVEMDFDKANDLTPRLRHAYGEYNGVMIGRNWSNYTSFVGNTSVLDFDGLPGTAGLQDRVEQFRYTTGPVSVSVENPVNRDIYVGGVGVGGKNSTPTFTAKLQDSMGGLSYAAAVMAKQTSYDTGAADDSAIGYGAFLAGKIALSDMISIQGAINYADGSTYSVYRAGGNFGQGDGYIDTGSGNLETIKAYGGALGASFAIGGGRSVNLGYGMATADLDDAVRDGGLAATTTDTNTMIFVNYQWTPIKDVTMGVEVANLETETQGGDDGDANRILFLAQYNF